MEYKIVVEAETSANTASGPTRGVAAALATKVNEEIRKGWEPIGGVAVNSDHNTWAQAMIKRES